MQIHYATSVEEDASLLATPAEGIHLVFWDCNMKLLQAETFRKKHLHLIMITRKYVLMFPILVYGDGGVGDDDGVVLCSSKDRKSSAKQRKKHRVLACISLPTSSSATKWNKVVSIGIRFTKLGLGLGLELGFVGF
ncbi:hypothetical protein VNO80_31582 [Phaseolus coccineus]|uniref:Uncharacterized protein n=1 Tax=Phaseolus coccineus TaxID=3886 RepID=A0AAN9L331_PHACN